jgi:lipoprotein-anchoring transpeptidase ErfK/SrfK
MTRDVAAVLGTALASNHGSQSQTIDRVRTVGQQSGVRRLFVPIPRVATRRWIVSSLLTIATVAAPMTGSAKVRKVIVVSIGHQVLWAYKGDNVVMSSYVSTGRAGFDTPLGSFAVLTKLPVQTMEGVIGGEYYNVPDVPSVLYFTNSGHALHGTYWHSNFGMPMSHGCINLPIDVAAWLYNWAPVGTRVLIVL